MTWAWCWLPALSQGDVGVPQCGGGGGGGPILGKAWGWVLAAI